MMMLRLPARAAASQIVSALHSALSHDWISLRKGSPGMWVWKLVIPCVPGHAPVEIVVQFGGVTVGSGARQFSAQTPLSIKRLKAGNSPACASSKIR